MPVFERVKRGSVGRQTDLSEKMLCLLSVVCRHCATDLAMHYERRAILFACAKLQLRIDGVSMRTTL
jgi:hypothetical protein